MLLTTARNKGEKGKKRLVKTPIASIKVSRYISTKLNAMKRLLTTLIAIFLFFLGFSQRQRLAILPSKMHGSGTDMPSVCIDIFRGGPVNQQYKPIGNQSSHEAFDVMHYGTVKKPVNSEPQYQSAKIIGETNEAVPEYYRQYIDKTISRYDNGSPITPDRLDELQDEIWAFNGLDYFRFINRSATDIQSAYTSARRKFMQEFELGGDASNKIIVDKLHELHDLRSLPKRSLSNLSFSNRRIRFTDRGTTKSLPVRYNEGLTGSLNATEVSAGVNRYNNFYRTAPDQASAKPGESGKALLRLSDEYSEKILEVNVSLNRGTALIHELQKLGVKVDNQIFAMITKEKK